MAQCHKHHTVASPVRYFNAELVREVAKIALDDVMFDLETLSYVSHLRSAFFPLLSFPPLLQMSQLSLRSEMSQGLSSKAPSLPLRTLSGVIGLHVSSSAEDALRGISAHSRQHERKAVKVCLPKVSSSASKWPHGQAVRGCFFSPLKKASRAPFRAERYQILAQM